MSSSERNSPIAIGERNDRRRARLRAVLVFGCGVLAGTVLTSAPWRAGDAGAPQDVSRVAGWDGADPHGEDEHPPAKADPPEEPAQAAAREPAPAVEVIEPPRRKRTAEVARRALGFTVFVRGGRVYGAGVLLDRAGHVLTCHHVIEGLQEISVSFSDGATFAATVLDSDPELDVALLKIAPGRKSELVPASVTTVELGDDVFAIGAPRKMAFSLSRGMASYVGRPFGDVYYLQTDLAMNAGSSGGPVMNEDGEVVAISSFVLRNSEGLAFALPIDYAYRRFAKWLRTPRALEGTKRDAFEGWLSSLERTRSALAMPRD